MFNEDERGQSVGLQLMRSRFRDRRGQQHSPGLEINGEVLANPGERLDRTSGFVDADGNSVAGTFEGSGGLRLQTGAEVDLLDSGGAVVNIIPV